MNAISKWMINIMYTKIRIVLFNASLSFLFFYCDKTRITQQKANPMKIVELFQNVCGHTTCVVLSLTEITNIDC